MPPLPRNTALGDPTKATAIARAIITFRYDPSRIKLAMTAQAHSIALRIIQDALLVLGSQTQANLPLTGNQLGPAAETAIANAKSLTQWPADASLGPLQIIFDTIRLKTGQRKDHVWPAVFIHNEAGSQSDCPTLPYPQLQSDPEQLNSLKADIKAELQALSADDWQNLPILTLVLEKYGSYLSYGQADIALFDLARATATVASSLADQPEAENLCLVAGDLSGIQPFIYTIASDGALKSLRASNC
jgi:CRISPR-associated protein Csm1